MTPQEELAILDAKEELAKLDAKEQESLNSSSQEMPGGEWGFGEEVKNAVTLGGTPVVGAFADTLRETAFDMYDGKDWEDIPFKENFNKTLKEDYYAPRDKYRKEHPWISTGASFLGGAGSPIGNIVGKYIQGGKLSGSGISKATNLRGRPPQLKDVFSPKERPIGHKHSWKNKPMPDIGLGETMRRGAIGGGGLAGAQGFMEAEGGFEERGIEGAKSAAFGTAFGGATPLVIKTGAQSLKHFADLISKAPGAVSVGGRFAPGAKQVQTTLAWRKLAEALERDGHTFESAQKRLNENPNLVIGDLGDNVRSLAYSVYARPSKGSTKLRNFVENRQKGKFGADDSQTIKGGQTARIDKKVNEMFPDKFQGVENQGEISKLYNSAFGKNQDLMSKELNYILNTAQGEKALPKAITAMRDSRKMAGKPDPELTAYWNEVEGVATPGGRGISKGFKLETWDFIKESFDEVIDSYDPVKQGRARRRAVELKNDLVKELDRLDVTGDGVSGDYKQARGLASTNFANRDANELGKKFIRNDVRVNDLEVTLSDMNPEQLHNYRIGAMDTIAFDLAKMKTGADKAQSILDNRVMQDKIKLVFGDDQKFGQYMKLLKDEADMSKLRKVMQGSQTTKNQGAVDDSLIDPSLATSGVLKFAGGNKMSGAMDLLKALRSKVFMREETADILGDALTSQKLGNINKKYKAREMKMPKQNALSRKIIQLGTPSLGKKKKRDEITKSILSAQ